jgi:hypothetical protein
VNRPIALRAPRDGAANDPPGALRPDCFRARSAWRPRAGRRVLDPDASRAHCPWPACSARLSRAGKAPASADGAPFPSAFCVLSRTCGAICFRGRSARFPGAGGRVLDPDAGRAHVPKSARSARIRRSRSAISFRVLCSFKGLRRQWLPTPLLRGSSERRQARFEPHRSTGASRGKRRPRPSARAGATTPGSTWGCSRRQENGCDKEARSTATRHFAPVFGFCQEIVRVVWMGRNILLSRWALVRTRPGQSAAIIASDPPGSKVLGATIQMQRARVPTAASRVYLNFAFRS